MALTGTLSTTNGYYRLDWSLTSQDTAHKTSSVKWNLYFIGSGTTSYQERRLQLSIDGTTIVNKSNTETRTSSTSGTLLYDGTSTIQHDSNGNKSFHIVIQAAINGSSYNEIASQWFLLYPIGVASTISSVKYGNSDTLVMGQAATVRIAQSNYTYSYTLSYLWGSNASYQTIVSKKAISSENDLTYSWTPPASLASAIPNAVTGTGTIRCETFDASGDSIGETSRTFYCSVPDDAVPTISTPTFALDNSANSVIENWNVAVAGYTKMKITATASGAYSSTIKRFVVDGTNIDGTSLDYTTPTLEASTGTKFSVYAVDTRGRNSETKTSSNYVVYDYANPTIISFSAKRNDGANTKVTVLGNWSFSSVNNKNAVTATVAYKEHSATSYTNSTTITKNTAKVLSQTFEDTKSYDIKLTVTDSVGNSVESTVFIPTKGVLLDFKAGGKGLGIGKISEYEAMEVDMDTKFYKDIQFLEEATLVGAFEHSGGSMILSTNNQTFTVNVEKSTPSSTASIKLNAADGVFIKGQEIDGTMYATSITSNLGGQVWFKRFGKVVQVYTSSTFALSSAKTEISVGTIPEGYRPAQTQIKLEANLDAWTQSGITGWFLYNSGNITCVSATTTSVERFLNVTYITDDDYPNDTKIPTDVLGLCVDYKNNTFKRLAGAYGLSAGSDFDSWTMYGGRKRCNVADDGTIEAYYGDSGFKEDGSNGQVMVYQPKFYYMVVPIEFEEQDTGIGYHTRKANYYVSATARIGFKLHPAFYDANGKEIDYVLIGAYEACLYDTSASKYITDDSQVMDANADKLSSIANVKPASGSSQTYTMANMEKLAKNRGTGWHMNTIKLVSMNQLLCMIEMGTMNFQTAIGNGVVSYAKGSGNEAVNTGSTSSLGNTTGRATSTTQVDSSGQTTTNTANGKVSISYRGMENPWGNMFEYVNGLNIWGNATMGGGQPYVCSDFNFAVSKNNGNYVQTNYTLNNQNGWISSIGYSSDYDWLLMSSECIGKTTNTSVTGDYVTRTSNLNGYRIASIGLAWSNNEGAGGFAWYLNHTVTAKSREIGTRLTYTPTAS